MNKLLTVLCFLEAFGLILISFPDGALSLLLISTISVPTVLLIHKYSEEKVLLTNIFIIALLLRISLGSFIHIFDLRDTFGPDAFFYDGTGRRMAEIWSGMPIPNDFLTYRTLNQNESGWGMTYLVAGIYYIFGSGILIAQSFCGTIGAITAPLMYVCAHKIFNNKTVSKISALSIALFPSFVIWSSQLLKDGLIVFLLVCSMTATLYLQKKFSYSAITFLALSFIGIIALRFYIFYMVAFAVTGSFLIGLSSSVQSIIRNILIILLLGFLLTYLGIVRNAGSNFEKFGDLKRVQMSRLDLASSAESGFGEDIDVSTPEGAITAVPIGLAYLFFAPFPWQVNKLNQILVLPETLLWWALTPILISGLVYTLKYKLRSAIPILIFSLMLTLFYSVFQGNVGMLYRQRTQIQVFLFIFIAVGWKLIQERKEIRKARVGLRIPN